MKKLLVLTTVFVSALSQAAVDKVLWQRFYAEFDYKDYESTCQTSRTGTYFNYFVAELEGTKVVRASLRVEMMPGRYQSFTFDPPGVAKIKMVQDATERFWIQSIPISAKALVWLVAHSDDLHCAPASQIKTITPFGQTFEFKVDEIETVNASYSPDTLFKGQTRKGGSYEMNLRLVQHGEFDLR